MVVLYSELPIGGFLSLVVLTSLGWAFRPALLRRGRRGVFPGVPSPLDPESWKDGKNGYS